MTTVSLTCEVAWFSRGASGKIPPGLQPGLFVLSAPVGSCGVSALSGMSLHAEWLFQLL